MGNARVYFMPCFVKVQFMPNALNSSFELKLSNFALCANRCLLRFLRSVFTSARHAVRNTSLDKNNSVSNQTISTRARSTYQVQRPANQVVPHAGAILTPAAADEDDGVLLDVVALAGDVSRDHAAAGQAHAGRLALARVGLLGPRDADLEAHALLLRRPRVRQRRRHRVPRALRLAASLVGTIR